MLEQKAYNKPKPKYFQLCCPSGVNSFPQEGRSQGILYPSQEVYKIRVCIHSLQLADLTLASPPLANSTPFPHQPFHFLLLLPGLLTEKNKSMFALREQGTSKSLIKTKHEPRVGFKYKPGLSSSSGTLNKAFKPF